MAQLVGFLLPTRVVDIQGVRRWTGALSFCFSVSGIWKKKKKRTVKGERGDHCYLPEQ